LAAATVTSKGQITLPVQVRNALGLKPGDRVEFVELEKGQFTMIPATLSVKELKGLLHDKRRKPVTIEEMNAAIAEGASTFFRPGKR
jgi:antitoxin PrlF